MAFFENTVESKNIFNGRILNLKVDTVVLPNGAQSTREIVDHKDAVAILPIKDGCIWFVRQFRKAIETTITEIPAGLVEIGEDPEETAIRELQEEIGLKPLNIEFIGEMFPSAGFSNEKVSIFTATEFLPSKKALDEDEFLDIVKIPIPTVELLFRLGKFRDAKTVCALG